MGFEIPVPARVQRSPEVSQTMARSRRPSPLMSPVDTAIGSRQPTRLPLVTVKLPEQLFCMTEYVPSPLLAVTRSRQASPLKWAATMEIGVTPVLLAEVTVVKPQFPSPVTTLMLLVSSLAEITSGLLSPLKSPVAM